MRCLFSLPLARQLGVPEQDTCHDGLNVRNERPCCQSGQHVYRRIWRPAGVP
jgi:hypothetical protein